MDCAGDKPTSDTLPKFDDDDDEQTWQHMTEEEESLAHEEEILQKELEEERKSIDFEVNRRTSGGDDGDVQMNDVTPKLLIRNDEVIYVTFQA